MDMHGFPDRATLSSSSRTPGAPEWGSCMASARGALPIQPTALVHEAWLKLESGGDKQWKNKAHFMGTAVRAMRCLLIDHARSRTTQKRGGGRAAMPLEEEL